MRTLSTLFAQDNHISGCGIQVAEETYWSVDQELPSEFQLYYECKGVTCLVIELKCACNTHGASRIVVNRLSWGVSGPNGLQSCPSWEIQGCYGGYQLIELGTLLNPNSTFPGSCLPLSLLFFYFFLVFLFLFFSSFLFPCLISFSFFSWSLYSYLSSFLLPCLPLSLSLSLSSLLVSCWLQQKLS